MTFSTFQLDVERECSRLCVDFANGVDAHDNTRVLDLFSDDAELVTPLATYRGRSEIAGFLEARPLSVVTRHLCTNVRISPLSETTASGHCYLQLFSVTSSVPPAYPLLAPMPVIAEYRDQFTRTVAGWKIQERRVKVVFTPH